MEFLKYVLIALLFGQAFYSGFLSVVLGLVAWTIIWLPIAFVINLLASDPMSYFGFWTVIWDWENSTWADLIHANIGAGLATLYALASSAKPTASDSIETPVEEKKG